MPSDAREIARKVVDAWNDGDLRPVYALFASDIVVRPDPDFPDSGVIHGATGARAFWDGNREALGGGRVEIVGEVENGDRCLVHCVQQVAAPASGVEGVYEWSFITSVRDGKVVLVEFFLDRGRAIEAFGDAG
jgi:ketosteroid isomerase-like protein